MKTKRIDVESAEQLRRVVARLGRTIRLTHVDGSLSPSQGEVLSTVVRRGPHRLFDLAANEGINPTMLSRIVGRLESAKLLTRTPDQADARIMNLAATEAGRTVWNEMRTERTNALLYALGGLSADQRLMIERALPVLESLIELLKNRDR